jgi:hypothetical protein
MLIIFLSPFFNDDYCLIPIAIGMIVIIALHICRLAY